MKSRKSPLAGLLFLILLFSMAQVSAQDFDFSVSASPENIDLTTSDSQYSTITVTLLSGAAENVSLSGAWVVTSPTGVTASFSENSGVPTFTSTLTFTKSSGATPGTFTYRVTGIDNSLTRTEDISVVVSVAPSAPTLASPGDNVATDSLTPTFDWYDVAGAENYTLEVATDNNFNNKVFTKITLESSAASEQLSYGTTYYWRVSATGLAGVGDLSEVWSFTSKISPPLVTSVVAANGATYSNVSVVQLTISAQNAVDMSFSDNGTDWSDWEAFQTTKTYTLPPGDGLKNIYARVRDNVGDISQTSKTTITLDQTPPSTTHDPSGKLDAAGYRNSVVIQLSSTDATSGVATTRYRVDNSIWSTGSTFVISTAGTHSVEFYSTDLAGNDENTNQFEIEVYVPSAFPEQIWIALAVIGGVAGASAITYRMMRTKRKLKAIDKERAELVRLMKETETKFYKDATISRGTFDAVMGEYRRRLAELEKDENLIKTKKKTTKSETKDEY